MCNITELSDLRIEQNKNTIIDLLKLTFRQGIDDLINYLESTNFFYDPASAYYHGAFKGGLAQHSLQVFYNLKRYYDLGLVEATFEEIVISALMHDICKANGYSLSTKNVKVGDVWQQVPVYKNEKPTFPYGHGEKSVDILRDYITLTTNEKLAIRYHMGAYESKECWNDLSYAQEISPLALWLHVADVVATRYYV